ncbi:MAG: RdgB/HAM1 family non-canonical purine NTP pyrophosphatase [Candidatus Omnitrophica bacterium]|nr:RdgB/HAM1 family non-canonical purine NTP pyrophosphatase [Candidatus Omnitrophota bacterium]
MKKSLLVATTNEKKYSEIRSLLQDLDLEIVSLRDLSPIQEVPESGVTFEKNAELKAVGYAQQTGLMTLAEDSGLCCDALEGAPGIYSARFSGEGKNDGDNNQKLLRLLEKVPDNCRGAYFKCVATLAQSGKILASFDGEVHGVIAKEPRGKNGFGYDPLFIYPPYGKTFGEIPQDMKFKVSHRTRALEKVGVYLATLFNP